MKKVHFIVPLLAIAVIIFLLVFLNKNNNTKDNLNSGRDEEDLQDQKTQGVENSNADIFIDSTNNEINVEGSGGGSGGGVSGEGASQITGCTTTQTSYSLENPQIIQICNAYSGVICTDKIITCSIEAHNLDNEIGGNFNLEIFFVEEGKDRSDRIETRNSKFLIAPGNFQLYEETLNIIGINENDTSNKEITCFYDTLETPKRETC